MNFLMQEIAFREGFSRGLKQSLPEGFKLSGDEALEIYFDRRSNAVAVAVRLCGERTAAIWKTDGDWKQAAKTGRAIGEWAGKVLSVRPKVHLQKRQTHAAAQGQ